MIPPQLPPPLCPAAYLFAAAYRRGFRKIQIARCKGVSRQYVNQEIDKYELYYGPIQQTGHKPYSMWSPKILIDYPLIERMRDLFSYDPDSGVLYYRRSRRPNIQAGDIAGSMSSTGCLTVGVDGRTHSVHVVVWAMVYGQWPSSDIGHIDHDMCNNRLSNLWETDRQGSQANQLLRRHSSKFKGVSWAKPNPSKSIYAGHWIAAIGVINAVIWIGNCDDEHDAALAYDAAAKIAFGHFARLNFPMEESDDVLLPDRVYQKLEEFLAGVSARHDHRYRMPTLRRADPRPTTKYGRATRRYERNLKK